MPPTPNCSSPLRLQSLPRPGSTAGTQRAAPGNSPQSGWKRLPAAQRPPRPGAGPKGDAQHTRTMRPGQASSAAPASASPAARRRGARGTTRGSGAPAPIPTGTVALPRRREPVGSECSAAAAAPRSAELCPAAPRARPCPGCPAAAPPLRSSAASAAPRTLPRRAPFHAIPPVYGPFPLPAAPFRSHSALRRIMDHNGEAGRGREARPYRPRPGPLRAPGRAGAARGAAGRGAAPGMRPGAR